MAWTTAQAGATNHLPSHIPSDFISAGGFLPIRDVPEAEARRIRAPKPYTPAPIATHFVFNGVSVGTRDHETQLEVFEETSFAKIPTGTKILSTKDRQNREIWEYPVGAAVVDLIRFRDERKTIFELRIVQKMPNGKWVFGSYSPDANRQLRLNTYPEWPDDSFSVTLSEGPRKGIKTHVDLKRIRLSACQACHFVNTLADYQYEQSKPSGELDFQKSIEATGPCGFVPTNPYVRSEWAPLFEKTYGVSPFKSESR